MFSLSQCFNSLYHKPGLASLNKISSTIKDLKLKTQQNLKFFSHFLSLFVGKQGHHDAFLISDIQTLPMPLMPVPDTVERFLYLIDHIHCLHIHCAFVVKVYLFINLLSSSWHLTKSLNTMINECCLQSVCQMSVNVNHLFLL